MPADDEPLFCDRCMKQLTPGSGDFFVVGIKAVADPSPPVIEESKLDIDSRPSLGQIVREAEQKSERELIDQVYRRLTLYLCNPCYAHWIENPVG